MRSKKYENQVKEYNENPNLCLCCGKPIYCTEKDRLSNIKIRKFCTPSCATSHNNKQKEKKCNRKCLKCGKNISHDNKSGYCQDCLREIKKNEKIEKWLNTGDTGCMAGSHLRNCIRDYIYQEQNCKCAICGCDNVWNGKELKFILDHIDGDAANNKHENLRLICPNCDSQLDTYKSKNKNSARNFRHKYYELYNKAS